MKKLIWCLILAPFFCAAQNYAVKSLNENTKTSIRGLSVVDDKIIWTSGSNGTIGKSVDGGYSWEWIIPKGYEKLDFRDIEAFNELEAIVVNAGSPAYVLKTINGGKTWTETYKNTDTAIFLDGLGVWSKNKAIIFGDPIDNKMQLLKSINGGKSWKNISSKMNPSLVKGEAGFAASGTTIKTLPGGQVWIATGGMISHIYHSKNYGSDWQVYKCPIWQGESTTGPFSIDFYDANIGVAVGGNYVRDKDNSNNIVLTNDGGKTWRKPKTPVYGYRSAVAYINTKTLIATGTSGTDVSLDGGENWSHISDISFNSVQKAKNGKVVILAGNKGFIYQLEEK
ncbi:oxidoreductase [Pedobacter aquatilis]|uniref:WD40/YVTN/BNR-like repeat-containing protein n=1 Tax=Pedobacter aquatilis TaxID=351343 RepID=UPI0025B42E59|nr:oxidoreductase [Pedobacter aquatilis]MDN3588863.1 oxidoreductase [Pedobacter aquatilis]